MTLKAGRQNPLSRQADLAGRVRKLEREKVAGSPAVAVLTRRTPQSIFLVNQDNVKWTSFVTSDPTLFATGATPAAESSASGNQIVFLKGVGLYLMQSYVRWATATTSARAFIDAQAGGFGSPLGRPVALPTNIDVNVTLDPLITPNDPYLVDTYQVLTAEAGIGNWVVVSCFNGDGVDRAIEDANLIIYYWPSSGALTTLF